MVDQLLREWPPGYGGPCRVLSKQPFPRLNCLQLARD